MDAGESDIGFQAGVGVASGVIAAAAVAVGAVAAAVSSTTVLGLVPTVLTAGTVAGHLTAKRAPGLTSWLGSRRRRRVACLLPGAAFAGLAVLAGTAADATLATVAIVSSVTSGLAGFGVARMARHRHIDATIEEPVVSWRYVRAGVLAGPMASSLLVALVFTVTGGIRLATGDAGFGAVWVVMGLGFLVWLAFAQYRGEDAFDATDHWNPPTLEAHASGLVVRGTVSTKRIPWKSFGDSYLTEDALVLERPYRLDLRGDLALMDDPDAVLAGIKRARRAQHTARSGRDTSIETQQNDELVERN